MDEEQEQGPVFNQYSTDFDFKFIRNKRGVIHHTIPGTQAQTSGNYSVIFIAPCPLVILGAKEVHTAAGTDASAVTLDIEKLTGTQAPGAGVSILKDTFDLKGTADTIQSTLPTLTSNDRNLFKDDRIALEVTGTLTAVENVTIIIEYQFQV